MLDASMLPVIELYLLIFDHVSKSMITNKFLPSTLSAVELVAEQFLVPHTFSAIIVTVYAVFEFNGVVSVEVTLGLNTSL